MRTDCYQGRASTVTRWQSRMHEAEHGTEEGKGHAGAKKKKRTVKTNKVFPLWTQWWMQGAHALTVAWGLVRSCSEEVFDLLGEVAAKSSYSKVLVGEWSGRLPWLPWEKGMSDGLIPNSFTLHGSAESRWRKQSRRREVIQESERGKEHSVQLTANFTHWSIKKKIKNKKIPASTGRGLKGPEICLELSQCPIHKST